MTNRRLESMHFKVFRRLSADVPDGEVWHQDSPDFRVHTASRLIGVEHCLVHIPTAAQTPLRAVESQTDEIIADAQEHAELRGTPPILAQFLFGHYSTLQKSERTDLARAIARAVHEVVLGMNLSQPLSSIAIRRVEDPRLPAPLSSARITALPKESRHFWRCSRAGWAVEDCRHLIQDTINEKARHYPEYLRNCQECWLLLVAEARPSSFIHPNRQTLEHEFVGPFERVYFLDLAQQVPYMLNTTSG